MSKGRTERVEVPSSDDAQANSDIDTALEAGNEAGSVEQGGEDSRDDGSLGDAGQAFVTGQNTIYDDDYIRDEAGNLTYSPTGRLRKRRKRRNSGDAAPQRGTRPTGEKVSVKELQEAIETNAAIIYGGHIVVAKVGNVPEMELNASEAEILSTAITPILVDNGIQPPKWVKDFTNIVGAFSYVYGPRFKMIGDRMKEEKAAKAAKQAQSQHRQIVPVGGHEPPIFSPSPFNPGPLDKIVN
jgi:hypothetical protein